MTTTQNTFDLAVIGAGPGGYIAAIRAAQLGLTVVCIEQWKNAQGQVALGGTCLNVGCIPSKALLASSEAYEQIQHLDVHGIQVQKMELSIEKMLARKNTIVKKMTQGIEYLFKKNKVTWLKGHAKFLSKNDFGYQIEISTAEQKIVAKQVIIATGSKTRPLPDSTIDNQFICDNEGALNFEKVPKRLGVIGAGVIGLELGSVWRRLGAEVTLLEQQSEFLVNADQHIAKEAYKQLTQQGLKIQLGVQIKNIKRNDQTIHIDYLDNTQKSQQLLCERLIVAIGRIPNTDDLGLANIGLGVNERGFIDVDEHCRTKLPNIYAIGDVVRGPMLAHKAEEEGVMVAEIIAGQKPQIHYECIPSVLYTAPEIAWVGATEQQLKTSGRAYKTGQVPFSINGRALGMNAAAGFVKMLVDANTDEILGVHIIAANASDLIAEAVVAMEFKAASEDIARICHAHPSLSEVIREAALACDQRALNM